MQKISIVLDCTFGDSGKGLTVNNLIDEPTKSLVVRFSGGHQVGHTVIENGVKHVFSNFGAGALKGVPTYYTEDTCVYLNTLFKELEVLNSKGFEPVNYLHPLVKVATPYDLAYNRIREKKLGHGSVGLGFGATMKRSIETPYKLYAIDFFHKKIIKEKIKSISDYYNNLIRLEGFGYSEIEEFESICRWELTNFTENLNKKFPFKIVYPKNIESFEHIIFEGSQGIMLDMDFGIFPNVTYANTTSKNALKFAKNYLQSCNTDIYYVTRAYQTRHGAGWMSNERKIKLKNTKEEINTYNEFQKDFRLGNFDADLVKSGICYDSIFHESPVARKLVITCIDQVDTSPDYSEFKELEIIENDSPHSGHFKRIN